jgi:hypothetical protein
MSIHVLLRDYAFSPEDTVALIRAYETALVKMGVAGSDDHTRERVARAIIQLAGYGTRHSETLCDRAVWALSK